MINSAVSNALMPRPVTATAIAPPTIGYAFVVHQLALRELASNHFLGTIIDKDTGAVLKYRHLIKNPATKLVWETSFANKTGRLFQGIHDLKGTNTCFFIQNLQVPTNKKPNYGGIVCIFCPQKQEQNHTYLTVGSNQIDYPGNKSMPTANLTTNKLLINSTISTPRAIFLGINLANFYVDTPLPTYKYMCLHLDIIPEEIILAYNLRDIVNPDGWVYIEIRKGRYGLPQAGILAIAGGITNANTRRDCGITCGGPSPFTSLLTTLA
jgi:hypothetical protein